jgi:hypothetical protein
MWTLTGWARRSNEAAVCNARDAAADLARRRVEAHGVEIYLTQLAEHGDRAPAQRHPA